MPPEVIALLEGVRVEFVSGCAQVCTEMGDVSAQVPMVGVGVCVHVCVCVCVCLCVCVCPLFVLQLHFHPSRSSILNPTPPRLPHSTPPSILGPHFHPPKTPPASTGDGDGAGRDGAESGSWLLPPTGGEPGRGKKEKKRENPWVEVKNSLSGGDWRRPSLTPAQGEMDAQPVPH